MRYLSRLLENYLIPSPKIGILKKPYSALVLHFTEFNSKVFQPCEAVHLSIPEAEYDCGPGIRGVTVLVSPSNYHNLRASYSKFPRVTVRKLKFHSHDLTIQTILMLMCVHTSSNPPLYMASVTNVLQDMSASGDDFDFRDFKSRLPALEKELNPNQWQMLKQRLKLLETYLDLDASGSGCFGRIEAEQQLTIVDLSSPFVEAGSACALFNICIGLFMSETNSSRVIALDEAHKVTFSN